MSFRVAAKHFFLTYPQSGELSHSELHEFLDNLEKVENVFSCREDHTENGEHHHAIVSFESKFNCRNERKFDYGGHHPNIQAVRRLDSSIQYIEKDGNTLGGPPRGNKEATKNVYARALDCTNRHEYMAFFEREDPRSYQLNLQKLEYFARKRFGDLAEPTAPRYLEFNNVPEALNKWCAEELRGGKDRPLNLILIGDYKCGKTSWSTSLGTHHHWVNNLTEEKTKGATYAIMDDITRYNEQRENFKGIWGSQLKIGVKVKNGVSGYQTWDWGIPAIWLWNACDVPSIIWNEHSYERQASVYVDLVRNRLY